MLRKLLEKWNLDCAKRVKRKCNRKINILDKNQKKMAPEHKQRFSKNQTELVALRGQTAVYLPSRLT